MIEVMWKITLVSTLLYVNLYNMSYINAIRWYVYDIYIYARIVRLCYWPKFFHAISTPLCPLHDNKCNHFCRSQHFAHSSTHCWNQGQNEYSTGKLKVFALHGSFPLPTSLLAQHNLRNPKFWIILMSEAHVWSEIGSPCFLIHEQRWK